MTVKDLIEKLSKFDLDLEVVSYDFENYDYGKLSSIDIEEVGKFDIHGHAKKRLKRDKIFSTVLVIS